MRTAIVVILMSVLASSCGVMSTLKQVSDDYKATRDELMELKPYWKLIQDGSKATIESISGLSEELKGASAELKKAHAEAFAKADKNQDGKISGIGEILTYLSVGGASLAAAVAEFMRRQAKAAKSEASELKKEVAELSSEEAS